MGARILEPLTMRQCFLIGQPASGSRIAAMLLRPPAPESFIHLCFSRIFVFYVVLRRKICGTT